MEKYLDNVMRQDAVTIRNELKRLSRKIELARRSALVGSKVRQILEAGDKELDALERL